MIKSRNVRYEYVDGKLFSFPDIDLKAAETMLIHGDSGVGKTTLLNLLGLLIRPKEGHIYINDIETSVISEAELPQFRAKHVGLVYQKSYFVESLTVLDNLLLASYFGKNTEGKKTARNLADSLGFSELLLKKTMSLSGGEQQRVSIARALMNKPTLVLADEPTSALDDGNTEAVFNLLEGQCRENGAALICVSHDQRLKSKITNQVAL